MQTPKDMTERQFRAALAKHGFKQTLLWISDTTGRTSTSWGVIYNARTMRTMRRATLAKVIRARDDEPALVYAP